MGTASFAETDQFDRVTAFLRRRGVLRSAQLLMAALNCSAALVPLSGLFAARTTPGLVVVGVGGTAVCAVMAAWWVTRWPTRGVSLYSVSIGAVCASAWSISQPSPAIGALGCTVLAVTGGYIALFHGLRAVLVNVGIATVTAVLTALRLAGHDGVPTALAAFWVMWLLNFAVPIGVRGLSTAMTRYARACDEDPLTGLLNRRGFGDTVRLLLIDEVRAQPTRHLVVIMIDLDNFKAVNDTLGHATGDRILTAIADLLRATMPATAALCRCGGEEFLIALTSPERGAPDYTSPLCAAIKAHTDGVTASVGVASADGDEALTTPPDDLVDRLVDAADRAMYDAKRQGGNHIQHARRHCRCT
ncbi:GGDEF domain-containing protein [Mycobacterium sp. MYCO198283]|uniref:GGDEF domain-containing protein n=1 Tax=Mycobacterium sp. MYCO198283 TaxID=2883505 RepID=UPI001E5009B1|nr:GGDEF domain-containing protein [Mycobacterium sp. MYCO198283]MCG5432126.1 GGDEF domain-containing protein [Mycobacterium sp. MYCO198283]